MNNFLNSTFYLMLRYGFIFNGVEPVPTSSNIPGSALGYSGGHNSGIS